MSFCPNFCNSKIGTHWHWFGRLIHHYLTTGRQFPTSSPKIFLRKTILNFFKKWENRGQNTLRENWAEICLDFSPPPFSILQRKKTELGCQKVTSTLSRGKERKKKSKFGICHIIYVHDCSYQILKCAMFYLWPGVRKFWLSMINNFKQCCVIDSLLTKNFHWVKEVNVRDSRKCLQDIKNMKLFSWEEGLLEIRPNRRKGCQLHLTENVLQGILLP